MDNSTTTTTTTTTYIVEAPSGARYGNCILGRGATPAEAWADAYGPKPWTPYVKRCSREAWCRPVEPGEDISEY